MESCLYHPQLGYYAKAEQQPQRDYLTSVDVTPLFGRLLARQFRQMWAQLEKPDPFWLVEAGAGTGCLARQILDFTKGSLPEFHAVLRYVAVERSEARRTRQASVLEPHRKQGRFTSSVQMPGEIPCGCIFSNELLDAMPVHRVARTGKDLSEIYVAFGEGGFCEKAGPLSSPRLSEYFAEQEIELHEGQHAEVSLNACDWVEEAARRLRRGFVLTIDYGREACELYDERHMRGTLLAYERHRASEDFFRAPGEQDLTAHVNFTALDLWGQRGVLHRTGLTTQTNFLLAILRHFGYVDLQSSSMTESQMSHARLFFKTLINPEGMGETFHVFAQHKNVDSPQLAGYESL
jgi:SAM-dependent MidA family methyltransferase